EIITYAMERARFKAAELVGRYGIKRDEIEDIQQDLITDVIERLVNFDGDLASGKTFVTRLINNRIGNIVEHRRARRRDCRQEDCSLDDWARDEEGGWVRRSDLTDEQRLRAHCGVYPQQQFEQADLAMEVAAVMATLPDDLRDLAI